MSREKNNIFEATSENIWNYQQNNPNLVLADIRNFIDNIWQFRNNKETLKDAIVNTVKQSMLCRGINKWLKNRRDIIAYKKVIKNQIKELQKQIPVLKQKSTETFADFKTTTPYQIFEHMQERTKYLLAKEKLKTLMEVRTALKAICMSDRWVDWDGKSVQDMNTIRASGD